ncbi:MAG: glutaredoxin family protein [bacterium]|nr:glutaredoxin family protein [bacterium]
MLIVYTKTGCPWCKDVLGFLRDKKVEFEEREVRGNAVYFDELRAKSGQEKTPTLDLNGEILADADKSAVEKFLMERKILI